MEAEKIQDKPKLTIWKKFFLARIPTSDIKKEIITQKTESKKSNEVLQKESNEALEKEIKFIIESGNEAQFKTLIEHNVQKNTFEEIKKKSQIVRGVDEECQKELLDLSLVINSFKDKKSQKNKVRTKL